MTAINCFLFGDRAQLVTDGITSTITGEVAWLRSKVVKLPRAKAAFAAGGSRMFADEVEKRAKAFRDFDELVGQLPAIVRAAHPPGSDAAGGTDAGGSVVLVGWSQTANEPQAYAIYTFEAWGEFPDMAPAFTTLRLQHRTSRCVWRLPCSDQERRNLRIWGFDIDAPGATAEREGLELLRLQREGNKDRPPHCRVGGFAEVTTVTAAGVTSTILERWPEDRPASFWRRMQLYCIDAAGRRHVRRSLANAA